MADLLTRRFQQRVALIGQRAAILIAAHWKSLPGYDEADIPTFARKAGPTLTGMKTAAVATSVAYYSTLAGVRVPSVNPRDVRVELNPREPFIAYWLALKNGHPIEDARLSGIARAEALVRNYATSSSRRAGDVVFDRTGTNVLWWNREPDGDACEWCLLIADQTYKSAETADFGHDRCNCTPIPIFAD